MATVVQKKKSETPQKETLTKLGVARVNTNKAILR